LTWHDIMVADLLDVPGLAAEDIEEFPLPDPTPADQVPQDGQTPCWVDLATYISLMMLTNANPDPITDRPPLTSDYLNGMSFWLVDHKDSTKANDPVLAWVLLGLLIDPAFATEFMAALPLNMNGPSSGTLDPLAAGSNSPASQPNSAVALWSMVVQNFRALIAYSPTKALDVQSFLFELGPPPADLHVISNQDFLTWTVPFADSLWSVGQMQIRHSGNLRVKMTRPLCVDTLVFCNFDGTLEV
jgi:hypothetical protein